MSCNIPVQKNVKQPEDCLCHGAVMRTFSSFIKAGRPVTVALDAAKIVYGYHHPEDSKVDRSLTVERWVNEGNIQ